MRVAEYSKTVMTEDQLFKKEAEKRGAECIILGEGESIDDETWWWKPTAGAGSTMRGPSSRAGGSRRRCVR